MLTGEFSTTKEFVIINTREYNGLLANFTFCDRNELEKYGFEEGVADNMKVNDIINNCWVDHSVILIKIN